MVYYGTVLDRQNRVGLNDGLTKTFILLSDTISIPVNALVNIQAKVLFIWGPKSCRMA